MTQETQSPGQPPSAGGPTAVTQTPGVDDVEVVDADEALPPPDASAGREVVSSPSKLIRIASMVRTMLDEVRHAPLDEAGRRRLRHIHERSLAELQDVLSPDLRAELGEVVLPFSEGTPSESELRVAQAQLVGWLEGLFHGIQATMASQQAMAQQQLEQMRRRALPPGQGQQPPGPVGPYL